MDKEIPIELEIKLNQKVLAYLENLSAHSDITDRLLLSIERLGDVQTFCPSFEHYRYVCCSSNNVIFAFAMGTSMIGFRLNSFFKKRALETGQHDFPEAGEDWVQFMLFENDWPEIDLNFWALKAYVYARELASNP